MATDSATCRSSAGCERPATRGTFARYFCETHFQEIDLIRRVWFNADGGLVRKPRDPDDAPLSLSDIADQMAAMVREAHPRPVQRGEIRRALRLPHDTLTQAAALASSRRQIVSTAHGYALPPAAD